jgi:hypothetical protein
MSISPVFFLATRCFFTTADKAHFWRVFSPDRTLSHRLGNAIHPYHFGMGIFQNDIDFVSLTHATIGRKRYHLISVWHGEPVEMTGFVGSTTKADVTRDGALHAIKKRTETEICTKLK